MEKKAENKIKSFLFPKKIIPIVLSCVVFFFLLGRVSTNYLKIVQLNRDIHYPEQNYRNISEMQDIKSTFPIYSLMVNSKITSVVSGLECTDSKSLYSNFLFCNDAILGKIDIHTTVFSKTCSFLNPVSELNHLKSCESKFIASLKFHPAQLSVLDNENEIYFKSFLILLNNYFQSQDPNILPKGFHTSDNHVLIVTYSSGIHELIFLKIMSNGDLVKTNWKFWNVNVTSFVDLLPQIHIEYKQ